MVFGKRIAKNPIHLGRKEVFRQKLPNVWSITGGPLLVLECVFENVSGKGEIYASATRNHLNNLFLNAIQPVVPKKSTRHRLKKLLSSGMNAKAAAHMHSPI